MLKAVTLKPKKFADYKDIIGEPLYQEVRELAGRLAGRRILHINATANGGGVAEILRSMVPLLRDLGVPAEWQTIDIDGEFFAITKKIHNSLQGFDEQLGDVEWQFYESISQKLAQSLDPSQWDAIVAHDPQPAAMIQYVAPSSCRWVWRCHLDTSSPVAEVGETFSRYLQKYNGAIFTSPKYVFADFGDCKVGVIPVAIDPLSPKNKPISHKEALTIVSRFGIDASRPFAAQVSRFDPWKDPVGVVKAWQMAKQRVPGLQLALIGNTAGDDPQSKDILADVKKLDKADDDFCVIADEADDRAVQAFQSAANAIIQQSIREGFGLSVTEALWAGTPVIGTKVGGIPLQIKDGVTGYLVDGVTETADRIVKIVEDSVSAQRMGQAGHEHIRQHFLLPRMIRDHLKFLIDLA